MALTRNVLSYHLSNHGVFALIRLFFLEPMSNLNLNVKKMMQLYELTNLSRRIEPGYGEQCLKTPGQAEPTGPTRPGPEEF